MFLTKPYTHFVTAGNKINVFSELKISRQETGNYAGFFVYTGTGCAKERGVVRVAGMFDFLITDPTKIYCYAIDFVMEKGKTYRIVPL